MLPDDKPPVSPSFPTPEPEIEPISPQEAASILKTALEPYSADGWRVIDQSAYDARLTRGTRNLTIRIDLVGQVVTEQSGLTSLQDRGRLTAWVLLLAMLLVALAL